MKKATDFLAMSMEHVISEIEQEMANVAPTGKLGISVDHYPESIRACDALINEIKDAGFEVKTSFGLLTEISWQKPTTAVMQLPKYDEDIPTISTDSVES